MSYNFHQPQIPPPPNISDSNWNHTLGSMMQNNVKPGSISATFQANTMGNGQKHHSDKSKDEIKVRGDGDNDNSREGDRRLERDRSDRSRFENRSLGRSRSPDRYRRNNVKEPQINRPSDFSAQQGMLFGNVPIGTMFPNTMLNASMGMMGGLMMDSPLIGLAMTNQLSVVPGNSESISEFIPNAPVTKEIIALKSCTLLPPFPATSAPPLRKKPLGCRTIFVGGLIDNIQKSVVTEIFERYGEITSIRLSRKNFCHIRYKNEESVDQAVALSGYRMRIDDKDEDGKLKPASSWLHVDYALARDDQHEYDLKHRSEEREKRHREKDISRSSSTGYPPSPPLVHHFNEAEAATIAERLKQETTFLPAIQILVTWLERGDCNKKNVNTFYSLIQNLNSHIRRLLSEKAIQEEELQMFKDTVRVKMQNILHEFLQVEKVFIAASHKKVWDHFTKAQRKNIDVWKNQSMEIRSIQSSELIAENLGADEMDCSDSDDETNKLEKTMSYDQLQEENNALQCKVDAYTNEVAVLKQEAAHLKIQVSQLQQQLDSKMSDASSLAFNIKGEEKPPMNIKMQKDLSFDDNKAKLVGIIATFLHIHPFGASSDYIWSYIQKIISSIKPSQVEDVLREFPTVFVQKVCGVGANIERKWIFTGLND